MARAGKNGIAISFCNNAQKSKLETIEKEFIKIIKESPYYNKELVEAIKRSNIYYSLDKKGRIKFLKEHNYTGIENISGNVLVMVDHKNKKVTTGKKENI